MADEKKISVREVTLAVLAGGAGTRMGIPKAQLRVRETPILKWLLERWAWEGPTLLVTAPGREHPPGCEGFNREAVDAAIDQGPMRGLVTALEAAGTELIVVATCDMPLVQGHQLAWLARRSPEFSSADGVLLARQVDGVAQVEPFPCALRREAVRVLRSRLASGQFAMRALAELAQFRVLSAPGEWDERTWMNLNRPEDLEGLERALLWVV